MQIKQIVWTQPNRRNDPPLHIAEKGTRLSTLTGVAWVNEHLFVVNHMSGLRLALFNIRAGNAPLLVAPIPHRSDNIAVKPLDKMRWEIAVSGCWECLYTTFHLTLGKNPQISPKLTRHHDDRSFSHGVFYDADGSLTVAVSTGVNPRILIDETAWVLPSPWGARDICQDLTDKTYYAVTNSNTPKQSAYDRAAVSIWRKRINEDRWVMWRQIEHAHADTCKIYRGYLWFTDQLNDAVIGLHLLDQASDIYVKSKLFDFSHGLDISARGQLAVTNYGSSSICITSLDAALQEASGSHNTTRTDPL
jgi:hypothetical protein